MAQKIHAIRGMNDVLPTESYKWGYVEATLRTLLADYGYQNIRTPLLEDTRLFVRSIGEVTDIVEKEMYSFVDALNGDHLTLRPEGTASTLRAVIEHNLLYNTTLRLWYMGPMFRHERPQKGRYRQFHQLGVEALGLAGPDIDVEMIMLTSDLWKRLGIAERVELQINTLGQPEERAVYRESLIRYLEAHKDSLDEEAQRRMYTNPLRVLDTKNPALQPLCDGAPRLIDFLGDASRSHYDSWRSMLSSLGIPYVENTRLVRGLDYYNRSVFEWVTTELGAQGTVCAGGRYDGLIEQLGGKPACGIGFALGIERLVLLLEEQGKPLEPCPLHVYLVNQGTGVGEYAFKLARELRNAGLTVLHHCGEASFKSQLKKADVSGARFAVIVGEEECSSGTVTIKPLRQNVDQFTIALSEVVETLVQLQAQ